MSWYGPHPKSGSTIPCGCCGKDVYSPLARPRKFCGLACRSAAVQSKRIKDGEARCAKCRTWKPISDFVKGRRGLPHSYCKVCSSDWFAARRGADEETRTPYRPAYKLTDEQKKSNKREANRRQHMVRRGAGKAPHKFDLGKMLCIQDAKCVYCRKLLTEYHIDHKMPVSRGGTNDIENLQMTCPKCNMRKGAMTHEEFLASKKRKVTNWL